MAFCPYLPLNSVTWKEGYIPQTGITLHCSVSFKIVRAFNAMKTSHHLPSSTSLPESFLLSLPSSLDILNLPASVTAWSLDCHRSLTPASCPMQPPWETQLLLLYFLMKNWLLTFLGGRRSKALKESCGKEVSPIQVSNYYPLIFMWDFRCYFAVDVFAVFSFGVWVIFLVTLQQ